ncbi:nucleoporin NDC1 isoform X1 [Hippocampus zosterae]|uniref:nucleoporin NDC1 isoform X1 n=1 Tax=Hippocampus zosterae TaxID=109293 RepID=UPI00223D0189|nr:nucleoporin NDC1 isoform X1 [Hippocampus zosterae]XP_051943726.1 nucleoporin NDC1 isoform X1 [Hippocampus zosterae]XP_051943727.1 nucleoporin NDC1 isoform X1 [Hippocampus zosterae]
MFSADQNCWFVRKVICWRAAASIAWAVLLLPPTTAVFVILSKFSLFFPIQTLSECLSVMTSASGVLSFVLLCSVTTMVGFLIFVYYTVIPTVACSKIALLGLLLHPRHVANSLLHCFMGIMVAWWAAVTIGGRYEMNTYPCGVEDAPPQMCLNEYHLILLLAGAFVGFSHNLFGVIHNMNYVSFPTVQQYKYLRFKESLPLVVKCSAVQALYSIRNYILVYFFLGYIPREWICKMFNLHLNSSTHRLDTISGLLDLTLLYHLWSSATFLLFTWYTALLLFRIFITEDYSFPIQSSFTEDVHQCLPRVLSDPKPGILKFLALQDLALLSQHSPWRRGEVFSLSQPGGHPHNWNAISKECQSLLADLTQRLIAYHDSVATNGRAKSLSSGSGELKSTSDSSSVISGAEDQRSPMARNVPIQSPDCVFGSTQPRHSTAPFTPPYQDSYFSSPNLRRLATSVYQGSPWHGTVQSPHVMRRAPKLWSTPTDSQSSGSPLLSAAPLPSPKQVADQPGLLAQFLHNRKEQVKSFLSKRVLIAYLFNKLPEASSEALFAGSQAHIWALEGLSYLVQASFSEDHFGVVQTALPSILSTMLLLQEAVDRHFKLPHASTKPMRTAGGMVEPAYKTLRFALRAALKTAIYRITTTFGDHLNAVHMSAEHRKRLQLFLHYKE